MTVEIKRVYEPRRKSDGIRVLVDRLWPRGVRKSELDMSLWMKEIAPSPELRRWFNHDPAHWKQFQVRYRRELDHNPEAVNQLLEIAQKHTLTLLYAARDPVHNHARVLADYLVRQDPSLA